MDKNGFNNDWTVYKHGQQEGVPETLPHDAMIQEARDPDCDNDSHTGFYPGGTYTYVKKWVVPAEFEES